MKKQLIFQSRILEHLGDKLVTSCAVAMTELIKNSLDAKSSEVRVHSFTNIANIDDSQFMSSKDNGILEIIAEEDDGSSVLVVEDIGIGMTEETLENGFLNVGTDIKRTDNSDYFGEKGIGRLATQKLGMTLIVETSYKEEDTVHVLVFKWKQLFEGSITENIKVPYYELMKPKFIDKRSAGGYTRLWILGFNCSSLFSLNEQISLFLNTDSKLNSDLESAVALLVSPFESNRVKTNLPIISFYHNGGEIKYKFDNGLLKLSESTHTFTIIEVNGDLKINVKMEVHPWFIKRVHRSQIKPVLRFPEYRIEDEKYVELLVKYKERYDTILDRIMSYEDIVALIRNKRLSSINKKDRKEGLEEMINSRVEHDLKCLKPILPISCEIFTYKVGNPEIEMALEFGDNNEGLTAGYTINDVKKFNQTYSGIKLYRNGYRIGTLGNKTDDWIEMQQYRTKGQQFYRFNPATTVGYVDIKDSNQQYIREISSRLDIDENSTSDVFKEILILIVNDVFFEMNRQADQITKVILDEEGHLQKKLKERIKDQLIITKELEKENKRLINEIEKTKQLLSRNIIESDDGVLLPKSTYDDAMSVFDHATSHALRNEDNYSQTQHFIEETQKGIEKIEVEAYNNFKLMANGLITETITHELKTAIGDQNQMDTEKHFDEIGDFLTYNNVELYNKEFEPLRDHYTILNNKVTKLSNLYSFLDKTFITKESFSIFFPEYISKTIKEIEGNLMNELNKIDTIINYEDIDAYWLIPKGVMLHVLFNLFTNSIHWIDYRKKQSRKNESLKYDGAHHITLKQIADNQIDVFDSGYGVIKNMEYVLFDPLQSGKKDENRRGMGLYIVKQILNSFGGDIVLREERNELGNRYIFSITVPDDNVLGGKDE